MPVAERKSEQLSWLRSINAMEIGQVITPNAQKLLTALDADEIDLSEVSRLLALEPVLTAKLLMITNSPFYGFPREIKDIEEAIVVLGASKLNNLVYSSLVLVPDTQQKQRQYINHSLASAMFAKAIAQKLGKPPEIPFIAALLHVLPVITGYQEGIERLLSMAVLKESSTLLLQRLKLPEAAIEAVEGLYSPQTTNFHALCIRMAFNLSLIALDKEKAPFTHLLDTEHDFQKLHLSPRDVAEIYTAQKLELKSLMELAG